MNRLFTTLWPLILCVSTAHDVWGQAIASSQDAPRESRSEVLLDAVLEVRQDIERDTEALNRLRSEIAAERVPLAERLETLRREVAGSREELDRLRANQREGERVRGELTAEVQALEAECQSLIDLFREHGRAAETRVSLPEGPSLAAALQSAGDELARAQVELDRLPEAAGALLEAAEAWNMGRFGGHRLEGTALDERGMEHAGDFAVWGPVAYFRSQDGALCGPATTQFGSLLPLVEGDTTDPDRHAIGTVIDGGEALLPIDASGGDALRIRRARISWWEHVRQGGFVMVPLLGVGLLATVLAVWKFIQLWRLRIGPGAGLGDLMERVRAGDLDGARGQLSSLREPLASLLRAGLAHAHLPRAQLEEILHEHVLGTLPRLERHLGTLAVVGGVAPLLGLLGTVTGMIHTFQLVTVFGSGDARLLSGGISEALVTTEFGLAIAIPVLLVHAFLARRARAVLSAMEQTALTLVNHLSGLGEGVQ
ncbi:MAG: MotA/TolQ/ExbB proton channel family protein [Verrucomicrobiota bacterium]|nr:MotA/TolQ/ExbB proton channel family protein [Verrucomicrobiota bacterium]